jgi:hypothetical protein
MNTGIQFNQFVETIECQAQSRQDVVARLNNCEIQSNASGSVWNIKGLGEFDATPTFHRSVAETLRIPTSYYADMAQDFPALLDANVNAWLRAEPNSSTKLMRLYDAKESGTGHGIARAVRSTSFLPLDNDELLHHLRPVLDEAGVTVQSCDIGERRTHLKLTTPRLKGDVKVGDTVEAGITISNSEIGYGNFSVQPFLYRLVCTNGMTTPVANDDAIKRIHRSSALECYRPFTHLVETNERKTAKEQIWRSISESVGQVLREATFRDLLERLKAANKVKVSAKTDTEKLIERIAKRFDLTAEEQSAALFNFETDNDKTVWGIANAITKIANGTQSYERATFLESAGGQLIGLDEKDWQRLTELN